MEQHSIDVEGATLGYAIEGSGRPLLVVGSSIYYPKTFSDHLKHSCMLICADLPHFVPLSAEFSTGSITFDLYARCIDAVRSTVGIDRVAIAGHSHHGNIALEYAKRYPGNVSHVIMIGTPPVNIAQTVEGSERYWISSASGTRKRLLRDRRMSVDADYLASLAPRDAYIARYVADAPLYWYDPGYDAAWLWEGMDFDMSAINAFRDLYRAYEMEWDAESLTVPALVVMGRHDYAVAPTLWNGVLPGMKNVVFEILDKSGHTPQFEQPEAFDRILLEWWG